MSEINLLTIALAAVPNMLAVLAGILINNSRLGDTNARISDLRSHMDSRFDDVDRRFDECAIFGDPSFIGWSRSSMRG